MICPYRQRFNRGRILSAHDNNLHKEQKVEDIEARLAHHERATSRALTVVLILVLVALTLSLAGLFL
jgi:hypothetical protein